MGSESMDDVPLDDWLLASTLTLVTDTTKWLRKDTSWD